MDLAEKEKDLLKVYSGLISNLHDLNIRDQWSTIQNGFSGRPFSSELQRMIFPKKY